MRKGGPELHDVDLLLVGHGASQAPADGWAVESHATAIRAQAIFASVQTALLTGGPDPAAALAGCRARRVHVVPLFMSAGAFVRKTLPERLGDDPRLKVCEPVGTHPKLAGIAAGRAAALCRDHGHAPGETPLWLVAHGASGDPDAGAAARECAARIVGFASVHVAFLDQSPRLEDVVFTNTSAVAVGFFADATGHASVDVPRILGAGVLYTGAIGPDPALAELIIARAAAPGDG